MRVSGLLREVSRRHSIHLLAIAHASEDPASAAELRAFCEGVETFPLVPPGRLRAIPIPKTVRRGCSPALADRVSELLPRFDLVHFAEPSLVPFVPGAARAAAVVDHPKIDYLLHREVAVLHGAGRLRTAFDVWKERRHLRRVLRTVRTNTTCSREDADRLQSLSPGGAFFVVPNAVDPRFLEPLPSPPDGEERILFCGSPDYEPNRHAIHLLIHEILPRVRRERPRVRLVLVGRGIGPDLRALAGKGVV